MSTQDFRLSYHACRAALVKRRAEPAPGRIQLLAGPRQVGKTTLLLEIAKQAGRRAVYAAADAPEAALPGFWERLLARAEDTAVAHGRAVLLLDEAHLLHGWAGHLKGAWDSFRRRKSRFTSSPPVPPRSVWPRARARAWPAGSSDSR